MSTHKEIEIVDKSGSPIAEFDRVSTRGKFLAEEKSAGGVGTINPKTGKPQSNADQWAQKQIYDKTVKKINSLSDGAGTRSKANGGKSPSLSEMSKYREFYFLIDSENPLVKIAVNQQVKKLQQTFPNWKFYPLYGK